MFLVGSNFEQQPLQATIYDSQNTSEGEESGELPNFKDTPYL
jgi:hypothetical protein